MVCKSPVSGTLFTTTLEIEDISKNADEEILLKYVFRETQEIFNEMFDIQEQCNADYRANEGELKKTERKRSESKRKKSANERRAESTSSEERSTEREEGNRRSKIAGGKRILRQGVQKQPENRKMNHEVLMQ